MKKTIALLLMICMLVVTSAHLVVFANYFPDLPDAHPNYNAVNELVESGIVSGYDDGTFQPEREINRTEFCALMARAFGFDKDSYVVKELPFSDVNPNYWGVAYISFCYEMGYVNGMGDGTFAPVQNITVAQAVKMTICAAGKGDEALKAAGEDWYTGYMRVADSYGILSRVGQHAEERAKRSTSAQLIYNVLLFNDGSLEKEEWNPSFDYEEPVKPDNPVENDEPNVSWNQLTQEEIDNAFANKDYTDIKVILVDPGHNYSGKDIGARIDSLGVREEVVTWQISDKLRHYLEDYGYTVYMTRDQLTDNIANTSTTDSLQARVDLSHEVLADLYISVHCNMGGGTGSETYCFSLEGYSAKLAYLIQKNISAATGFYNRGVKTAGFFVIKNTAMPSVLVETGFLDTEKDRALLLSEEGQDAIARAIADSVVEYDSMISR